MKSQSFLPMMPVMATYQTAPPTIAKAERISSALMTVIALREEGGVAGVPAGVRVACMEPSPLCVFHKNGREKSGS